MEMIVIRHGQSHVNLGNWDTLETMDTGLTELGHQQASALRDWLKSQNATADVLYSSTMKRTRETANYVAEALNLTPIFDDRIREVGNSYLDGKPIDEAALPRAYSREEKSSPFSPTVTDIENAESWMHFRIRVGHFVDELCRTYADKTVYVVAHGGVMSAMFDNLFNVGLQRLCDVHTVNTGWMRVVHQATQFSDWSLYSYNRVDHLVQSGLGDGRG